MDVDALPVPVQSNHTLPFHASVMESVRVNLLVYGGPQAFDEVLVKRTNYHACTPADAEATFMLDLWNEEARTLPA